MANRSHFFRIGLFVVLAVALFLVGLAIFGAGAIFRPKIELETYIKGSVQGLDIGSPLKFRGVPIGRVKSIGFTFNEYEIDKNSSVYNYVVIRMEVDREIFPGMFTRNLQPILDRNIDEGLRMRLEPQGVTGINYMNMDYLKSDRFPPLPIDWKPDSYYIPSAPSELTSFLDSINEILRQVEGLNLKGIGDSAVKLMENLNAAVVDGKFAQLSQDIQNLVKKMDAAVDSINLEQLGEGARDLIAGVKSSNEELRTILKNVEPASRLNADEISSMMTNLRILTENLRSLSESVQRDPSRLIFGKPPRRSNVFDQGNKKQPAR